MSSFTFNINPLSQFGTKSASIRRPRHILEFSHDHERKVHPLSDRSLKYYYPAFFDVPHVRPPRVDLTRGFEKWDRADDSIDGHLDALLQTIQAHEEQLLKNKADAREIRVAADIVAWRGIMTKIMTAAFDTYGDFELNATCYEGTIFVEENHSYVMASKQQQNSWRPRRGELSQEMMQYCGYKFESLSTMSQPWPDASRQEIETRDTEIVSNNEQYCSIVRTSIGNTTLVLAGEVDCVLGAKPESMNDPVPWVELKTTAHVELRDRHEARKYERKLLKFWAQSFLLGVPTIIIGFRGTNGDLVRMKELETRNIPNLVTKNEDTWNGNVCINMTAAFLDFVRATLMSKDGVWRIARRRGEPVIRIFQVEESGTGRILRPEFKEHRERMLVAAIAAKLGKDASPASATDEDTHEAPIL